MLPPRPVIRAARHVRTIAVELLLSTWSNGRVSGNARNPSGVRALWQQCAVVPCFKKRLVFEDSRGDKWASLHVNENGDPRDDDWTYVLRVVSGDPIDGTGSYKMYPDAWIEVLRAYGERDRLYGQINTR